MSKLPIPPNVSHCYNCVYCYHRDGLDLGMQEHWRCSNFGLFCENAKGDPYYKCGSRNQWKGFVSRYTSEIQSPIEPPIKKGFWARFFS